MLMGRLGIREFRDLAARDSRGQGSRTREQDRLQCVGWRRARACGPDADGFGKAVDDFRVIFIST